MLSGMGKDLLYALRMLRKSPGFALAAMLTLALGIGANSAVFSLVDALLLRPFPVDRPGELVAVTTSDQHHSEYPHGVSYRDFVDLRDGSPVFSGMVQHGPIQLSLTEGGQSEVIWGAMVSGEYFDVLGVRAALGRTFLPEEGRTPGTHPVVVLGHGFWQSRYGGDPRIVGRTITLNGHAFNVIGVAPEQFTGLEVIFSPAVFVPVMAQPQLAPRQPQILNSREAHNFRTWGRLKPGVAMEQAQVALDLQAQQLADAYPETNKGVRLRLYPSWEARFEAGTGQVMSMVSVLLMVVVGLVLLIACANVANLLLSRAVGRRRELAVRVALGASRGRLVRQFLTESLLLSLGGMVVALVVARWVTGAMASFRPGGDLPLAVAVQLDGRALAVTGLLALLTSVLFGLLPALRASRPDLVPALKGEESGGRWRRWSLRNALVVAQVSLSAVLLVCAGLFLWTMKNAEQADLGIRKEGLLLVAMDVDLANYDEPQGRTFFRSLVERVRALPGVNSAALAWPVPLDYFVDVTNMVIEGHQPPGPREDVGIQTSIVGTGYFDTVATPLVRGRDFRPDDNERGRRVVIVNETMARTYWPGQEPIGKRLWLENRNGPALEVIGVARDGKYRLYAEPPQPYLYLPLEQNYSRTVVLAVHTAGDPLRMGPTIRREVAALDSRVPVFSLQSMEQLLAGRAFLGPKTVSLLLGVFGAIGLALASVGVYSVIAYSVSRRTHEIGIRMALGARRGDVLRMVLRQGMTLAGIGLALGLTGAMAVARLVQSLLFGVGATHGLTHAGVAAVLLGVALAACYIPARRATRVDPLTALRYE